MLNKVKPVKNINKNLQSFEGIGHGQNEGTSHKQQYHAYE